MAITCSKLTIETLEQWWRQWRCSGVFIVNFGHISHVSIANFEQVNTGWDVYLINKNFFNDKNSGQWEAATRVCVRKRVLKNFTKFTGKHLCQSLTFNKVAG